MTKLTALALVLALAAPVSFAQASDHKTAPTAPVAAESAKAAEAAPAAGKEEKHAKKHAKKHGKHHAKKDAAAAAPAEGAVETPAEETKQFLGLIVTKSTLPPNIEKYQDVSVLFSLPA